MNSYFDSIFRLISRVPSSTTERFVIHVHCDANWQFPLSLASCSIAHSCQRHKMHFAKVVKLNFLIALTSKVVVISCSLSSRVDVCVESITNSSAAVTALILARGGSKGIKLKNIQTVDGVSLLGLSLTALQDCSKCFDSIWVSTDHELIAQEAERCENENWICSRVSHLTFFLFHSQIKWTFIGEIRSPH